METLKIILSNKDGTFLIFMIIIAFSVGVGSIIRHFTEKSKRKDQLRIAQEATKSKEIDAQLLHEKNIAKENNLLEKAIESGDTALIDKIANRRNPNS